MLTKKLIEGDILYSALHDKSIDLLASGYRFQMCREEFDMFWLSAYCSASFVVTR